MPSFKVPCPSCEAPVLIKNTNLIGTKVECPKCKYRFKVEEPAGDKAGDAKDKKLDKKTKTPGKNKKLVQIGVGVGAVVILSVVGIIAFGGSGKKPPQPPSNKSFGGPGGPGGQASTNPVEESKDPKDPKQPGEAPKLTIPFSTANATNLLPGQSVAVYRLNVAKLRQTPVFGALADDQLKKMFENSMGFSLDDVDGYLHCFAGDDRAPFGIIRLKNPAKPTDITSNPNLAATLEGKPKGVKKYNLFAIRSNPFINAVSHALSQASLFGELYERLPMATASTGVHGRPLGLCVYDTQHILIGEYGLLERYLGELAENGYPPFKTVMITAPVTAPPTPGTPGPPPAPATPGAPGAQGMPPTPPAPPKEPTKEPAPAPAGADKALTSIDTYRTVEYPLKKALDEMEATRFQGPMLVYAEKFDVRYYDPKAMKKDSQPLASFLEPITARLRYVSANVVVCTPRQLVANLKLVLGSDSDARTLAKEHFAFGLQQLAKQLTDFLTTDTAPTAVTFHDYTAGGSETSPGIGFPNESGSPYGPPLGPARPTGPGGPGMSGIPPVQIGSFPPMGTSGRPPMGYLPPSYGPPSGKPPVGSLPIPPGAGGPFGPMGPMGQDQQQPKEDKPAPAHLDLYMADNELLIAIDLSWADAVYKAKIAPRLESVVNSIRGKMAVFSADFSWHAVAAAGPKAEVALKRFPRGTAERRSSQERFGLAYPPQQRVSFYADLLPYLGRGDLAGRVQKTAAWYDEKNLPVAGEWVPELLVPYYPQSAWRATSPYAPDHVLGATNYVAVAGVGLDVARQNPNSEEFKKKVGITGYGWGSKAEEITDGLSNTIYLMQTPPGLQQPWIAGGGATVRGLDETDPMTGFKYTHPGRTKQGTYALMADGSVRWVPADIDPKVLRAMATRAGGDNKDLADIDKDAPKVEAPKVESPKTGELKTEPKKPEEKKPEDKKPEDKKPADPAPEPKEKK